MRERGLKTTSCLWQNSNIEFSFLVENSGQFEVVSVYCCHVKSANTPDPTVGQYMRVQESATANCACIKEKIKVYEPGRPGYLCTVFGTLACYYYFNCLIADILLVFMNVMLFSNLKMLKAHNFLITNDSFSIVISSSRIISSKIHINIFIVDIFCFSF